MDINNAKTIITNFPITPVKFEGKINLDKPFMNNDEFNKLLSDLESFMNKVGLVGGFNEIKNETKLNLEIKGHSLSSTRELNEEVLLSLLSEFFKGHNYKYKINRLYNDVFETQLIPIEKKPEFLYHYTNIETLALILSSKKMRFNNLSNLNDLYEGNSADLGELGKYIFAICWTAEEDESIPIWKMYTKNGVGIRIKLPIDWIDDNLKDSENYKVELSNFKDPIKVQYIDDEKYVVPKIVFDYKGNNILRIDKLGIHKKKSWEFENEWRYLIRLLPGKYNDSFNDKEIAVRLKNQVDIVEKDFLIKISDSALAKMELTLGPMIKKDDVNDLIVQALIHKYAKGIKYEYSKLKKINF